MSDRLTHKEPGPGRDSGRITDILSFFGIRPFNGASSKKEPRMTKELTRGYLGKKITVKPTEDTPRGRAFADEETKLRQRQIDVEGEIRRENEEYKRKRAAILRRFGEKEE